MTKVARLLANAWAMGNVAAVIGNLDSAVMTDAQFEELYREHFAYVWRSARRLGISEADADDVVQETFLVGRALLDAKRPDDVRSFLFGVVFNAVRRHRRKQKASASVASALAEVPVSCEAGPASDSARMEAAQLLERLLGLLNDDQRAVFVLVEMEGRTLREVGEILGASVNTAASRLRLAREKLAEAALRLQAQERWRTR